MEPQTERTYFTTTGAAEYICQVLGIDHVPDRPDRPLDAAFIRDLRKDHFPNAKKKGREWQVPTEEVDAWIKQSGLTPLSRWKRIYKSTKSIFYLVNKRRPATIIVWLSLLGTLVTLYQCMPRYSTSLTSILETSNLFSPAVKNETLVLIADILIEPCIEDPTCPDDPNNVTQRLIDAMRDALADHPHIRVERLKKYIYEEGGSEEAMKIGQRPEHNAAFVMWGNYVLEPDAEVYVFFDIMERTLPVFGNSYDEGYGPSHIQPTMFDFKTDLGTHWGQLTAFAIALTLYQERDHKNAVPLFDTAAQGIDSPLFQGMKRVLHYYRGANYYNLGRALEAKADLAALENEKQMQITDNLTIPILNLLGWLYSALGEKEKSLGYYNRALPLIIEVNDKSRHARILSNIGSVYDAPGESEEALGYYNQALQLIIEVGDKSGQAGILNNIGSIYSTLGKNEEALDYYNQALQLDIEIGNKLGQTVRLRNIGGVYSGLGDKQEALNYYNQALTLSRENGDKSGQVAITYSIGAVHANFGDPQKALFPFNQGLQLAIEIGDESKQAFFLNNIGYVYTTLDDTERALNYYNQSLSLSMKAGAKPVQAATLSNIGGFYYGLEKKEDALDYYNQALSLNIEIGDTRLEQVIRRNMSRVYKSSGEFHKAEEQMVIVVQISEAVGHPELEQDRRELGIIQALLAGQ